MKLQELIFIVLNLKDVWIGFSGALAGLHSILKVFFPS